MASCQTQKESKLPPCVTGESNIKAIRFYSVLVLGLVLIHSSNTLQQQHHHAVMSTPPIPIQFHSTTFASSITVPIHRFFILSSAALGKSICFGLFSPSLQASKQAKHVHLYAQAS